MVPSADPLFHRTGFLEDLFEMEITTTDWKEIILAPRRQGAKIIIFQGCWRPAWCPPLWEPRRSTAV